jgi:hypothetical protein
LGDKECIRTGDKTRARFRFMYYPEYVKEGARLIFREGRTKGIGMILHDIYFWLIEYTIGRITKIVPEEEEMGFVPLLSRKARKKMKALGTTDENNKEIVEAPLEISNPQAVNQATTKKEDKDTKSATSTSTTKKENPLKLSNNKIETVAMSTSKKETVPKKGTKK